MTGVIEVERVSKHYPVAKGLFGGKRVLKAVDGVSFSISAGQTLGLVGESGCGKSTTARLALGLIAPTSGRVTIDGQPMPPASSQHWRNMRRLLQLVHQNPLGALDRRMPVGHQVMEPLAIHRSAGSHRDHRNLALATFESVGLRTELFDRYPHEISGGQRQRVVMARALVLNPRVLVCDEPVSALDVSVQAQVLNLLQDQQARHGLTYLFISHDLRVVRQVADTIAIMYLGRIVEQGPVDDVLSAPAHPYTSALVSAMPSQGRKRRTRVLLGGDPPSPIDVPSGCAFHPRCRNASPQCASQTPLLHDISAGRQVACHAPRK